MLGLLKLGEPMDPCDDYWSSVFGGIPCEAIDPLFWFSGDPETNYGWLNTGPTDQRMLVDTGPFSLEVDKPITIIVGYTIGQGDSPLNSVTVGKEVSAFVQQFYQSNFDDNILPVEEENNLIVDEFKLFQNYPNPFNPVTRIKFQIPQAGKVTIKIYDILGAEVTTLLNEERPTGIYEIDFNASRLASGVYFYQLKAGSYIETKKMILLK
ncbi:MAG: T9SS type A sorting domain-containing protein [Bacteroidetes bacterium]|nr:T9SS type A sorting domain-containing protein [Bacteroidota bacterium]